MTDQGIVILAVSTLTAAVYTVRLVANAALRMQDRKNASLSGSTISTVSDERMARLEMAVESIAVEVERISEGQRFTTRLLTEQAHPLAPKLQPGKFDTPH